MWTMRFSILTALALAATPVAAQDWFTVYGYPELAGTDVIQISPVISNWQGQVTLELRVTRKSERMAYSGAPYRSYTGMAAVDCQARKGWLLTATFFGQPSWQGPPSAVSSFKPDEAPMVFADIPGAPAAKVITAACAASR